MKIKLTCFVVAAALILMSETSSAKLLPGESITRDPVTGDYTAIYWDEGEATDGTIVREIATSKLTTATKIDPAVTSSMQRIIGGTIRYDYTVANESSAQQPINDLFLTGLSPDTNIVGSTTLITDRNERMDFFASALSVPNADWYGSGGRIAGVSKAAIVHWYRNNRNWDMTLGIQSGTSLGGFGFESADLPGIQVMEVKGNNGDGRFTGISSEGGTRDSTISNEMDAIEKNDFVPVNSAAPMIAVPTPYDAAVTLENIQTHVHTWIAKQLLDATFSAQLDTSFQAAIAAYRANQPQTAIVQLQTMRTLIKQQQPDADKNDVTPTINLPAPPALIDLLAARILYFDLGYVISH